MCREISDLLAKFAYLPKVQDFLFQADYFRVPNTTSSNNYLENSQMGQWNNEGSDVDATVKSNFGKTKRFAMIKANADTVVVPREGEHWGAYDTDFQTILTMKETSFYQSDLFGLKTADEAGKIFFNETAGNHLEFTDDELYGWLDAYCL